MARSDHSRVFVIKHHLPTKDAALKTTKKSDSARSHNNKHYMIMVNRHEKMMVKKLTALGGSGMSVAGDSNIILDILSTIS